MPFHHPPLKTPLCIYFSYNVGSIEDTEVIICYVLMLQIFNIDASLHWLSLYSG